MLGSTHGHIDRRRSALLFEARGSYRDAEAAYKKAADYKLASISASAESFITLRALEADNAFRRLTDSVCFTSQASVLDEIIFGMEAAMRFLRLGGVAICVAAGLAAFQPARAANLVLITADEAKLPPPKGAVAVSSRGVTRGPKIELVSQTQNNVVQSPARIQVKFQTYGGAKVDLEAVQATYLRTPNVDLTARIKPFIDAAGIDVPAAELPPGDHMLRIDIKDSDGRTATTSFVLKVEK